MMFKIGIVLALIALNNAANLSNQTTNFSIISNETTTTAEPTATFLFAEQQETESLETTTTTTTAELNGKLIFFVSRFDSIYNKKISFHAITLNII